MTPRRYVPELSFTNELHLQSDGQLLELSTSLRRSVAAHNQMKKLATHRCITRSHRLCVLDSRVLVFVRRVFVSMVEIPSYMLGHSQYRHAVASGRAPNTQHRV
jgi:hypothetical protein